MALYQFAAVCARAMLKVGRSFSGQHLLWRLSDPLINGRDAITKGFGYRIPAVVSVQVCGKKLFLCGNPWTGVTCGVYWGGAEGFEPVETALVCRLSREYRTVFDIGANVGWFTLVMLLHNPRIEVIAFEPNPIVARCLEENMLLNKLKATIEMRAVSDGEGTAEFFVGTDDWASSLMPRGDLDQKIRVKTIPIDQFVHASGVIPDFIKIDVEGNEEQVLRGAKETLRVHGPDILCEIAPQTTDLDSIKSLLAETGYQKAWAFDGDRGVVEDSDMKRTRGRTVINYFFSRRQTPPGLTV